MGSLYLPQFPQADFLLQKQGFLGDEGGGFQAPFRREDACGMLLASLAWCVPRRPTSLARVEGPDPWGLEAGLPVGRGRGSGSGRGCRERLRSESRQRSPVVELKTQS